MKKILLIDDDRTVCQSLKLLLGKAGYEVHCIFNPLNALETVAAFGPDLVLLDMNFTVDTSGKQGLEMLQKLMGRFPKLPVILITGWGTMELAITGMKAGARDFIAKPWDNDNILSSVKTILQLETTEVAPTSKTPALDAIIGNSDEIQRIKAMIAQVGPTDATVLITGESGTGKELVAEAIHDCSQRNEENFVKVNLGGISSTLFESELFGHKKGAFTGAFSDREGRFQLANRGTIFLDEIGDLEMPSQVKLLRVLQEKTFESLGSSKAQKVNVRVISATHKPLEENVAQGSFREDLFYRINLINIHLPPLHQRPSDIPLLVKHFMDLLQESYGQKDIFIGKEAMDWLSKQHYPGNIRQLKNVVERAWLLEQSKELTIKSFQPHLAGPSTRSTSGIPKVGAMTLEEMEKAMITKAMNFHNGNISQVARSLGITRSALYRRLEKFGMS
ncbi:MAG: sigma-54 dependent transcriptional regulator [Saprospiraceae bacterium]|nr:sigma-54 dependent transcriptional regulator [Saprospiraceae bacterium]